MKRQHQLDVHIKFAMALPGCSLCEGIVACSKVQVRCLRSAVCYLGSGMLKQSEQFTAVAFVNCAASFVIHINVKVENQNWYQFFSIKMKLSQYFNP